jgi:hypothetical protein
MSRDRPVARVGGRRQGRSEGKPFTGFLAGHPQRVLAAAPVVALLASLDVTELDGRRGIGREVVETKVAKLLPREGQLPAVKNARLPSAMDGLWAHRDGSGRCPMARRVEGGCESTRLDQGRSTG